MYFSTIFSNSDSTTGATTTTDPVPVNNSAGRTLQVTGAPVSVPVVSGGG